MASAIKPRADGLVIAIDGPSGAGKSTVAHLLAERLGYLQIDTGAMYRAVAYLMHSRGIDPDDTAAVERLCRRVDIRLERSGGLQRVFANGQDVTARKDAESESTKARESAEAAVARCRDITGDRVHPQPSAYPCHCITTTG